MAHRCTIPSGDRESLWLVLQEVSYSLAPLLCPWFETRANLSLVCGRVAQSGKPRDWKTQRSEPSSSRIVKQTHSLSPTSALVEAQVPFLYLFVYVSQRRKPDRNVQRNLFGNKMAVGMEEGTHQSQHLTGNRESGREFGAVGADVVEATQSFPKYLLP